MAVTLVWTVWVDSRYLLMVVLVVDGEIEQLVTNQVEHIEHMMALLELSFQQCDGVSSSKLLSPSKAKWLSTMQWKTENWGWFETHGLGVNGFGLFTWPITGNLLGMGGVCCANWSMKTTIASKIVISKQMLSSNQENYWYLLRPTFSPASGGNINVSTMSMAVITHGTTSVITG